MGPTDDPGSKAIQAHSQDDVEPAEADLTEEKMRRALGLGGPGSGRILTLQNGAPRRGAGDLPARGRSRQDTSAGSNAVGDASASSPLQQRCAELQDQLATERQRHEEARRLLQRAELTVRDAETRLQHEALSRQDELTAVRQGAINAQRALDEVLFQAQQRDETQRAVAARARDDAQTVAKRSRAIGATRAPEAETAGLAAQDSTPSLPKKPGRPRTRPLPEPKPVRWWAPSFRAKTKG